MMNAHGDGSISPAALTRVAGRIAPASRLLRLLASAPPSFLLGAIDNPELTPQGMMLLLHNRQAPSELLGRIAGDRQWTRHHEIRRGVALHPRTPPLVARTMVSHLYWKQLAEVASAAHVNPLVRRQAEKTLAVRIEEMACGEQAALARMASRTLIGYLLRSAEPPVLRALIGNPRLVEADVVRISASRAADVDLLAALAGHATWSRRRGVRLALLANPNTPIPVSLSMLRGLPLQDLRRLVRSDKVARIVRVGAVRLLRSADRRASWRIASGCGDVRQIESCSSG